MSDLHTELELARALFGPQSSGGLGVRRVTATATSGSSDGTVSVDVGGEVVEVPVIGAVSTGDEVQLLVDNGAPIAVAATGWGDQLQATATSASAIATAVNQHVWTDTSGVHVTEQDQDATTGANVLLNSQGLLLRDGTDDLAAFAPGGVEFYDGTTTTASFSGSGAVIGDQAATHIELEPGRMSVVDTSEYVELRVDTGTIGQLLALFYAGEMSFSVDYGGGVRCRTVNQMEVQGIDVGMTGGSMGYITPTTSAPSAVDVTGWHIERLQDYPDSASDPYKQVVRATGVIHGTGLNISTAVAGQYRSSTYYIPLPVAAKGILAVKGLGFGTAMGGSSVAGMGALIGGTAASWQYASGNSIKSLQVMFTRPTSSTSSVIYQPVEVLLLTNIAG